MADAQTQVQRDAYFVKPTWDGFPDGIAIHAISPITINFDEMPISSASSTAGSEKHQCFDPGRGTPNNITFECHGTPDQIKSMESWQHKIGQGGDNRRGILAVTIINTKDNRKAILTVECHDCTLVRFNPFQGIYPHEIGMRTFSFEVAPDYVKLVKG